MFLSDGRPHASYRTLWKEGECGELSVLNTFLGTTCERPHEMHKDKKTNTQVQKETRSKVCEYFFEFLYKIL